MKIKKLLPLTLAAMFALAGCGEEPAPIEDDPSAKKTHTVEVSNMSDFDAEWRVGDPGKTLKIAITEDGVAGNATLAMTEKKLETMVDNASVLSINGFTVSAVGAGTAKITIKYYEAVKEINVTVLEKLTNKVKYGTVHEGTADDPFDNEDACKVGAWCKANNNATTEELYIRGEVESFYHSVGSRDDGAVSWYLKPAAGKTEKFEVYKCYAADGKTPLTDDNVWVGATVTAVGPITYYASGSQAETTAAKWVKVEGDKPEARKTINSTFAEALSVGKALSDGNATWDLYKFDAYVTIKDGDNYYLTESASTATAADAATMIELYGIKGDAAAGLLKGAKVTVEMVLKNYHGQVENGATPKSITVVTPGEAWTITYAGEGSVSEMLEIAKALADGATSDGVYKITGKVIAITSAYSTQYNNISFTIADDDAGETLTVFRLSCTAEVGATIVAGKTAVIAGKLQNFVKDSVHTYEVTNGSLISIA